LIAVRDDPDRPALVTSFRLTTRFLHLFWTDPELKTYALREPNRTMLQQTDEVFGDEFLASLYDYFNPWDACDEFYLGLASETGGRVLDLGCGTGRLACRIAQEGLSVTGADPAEGMLRVARSRRRTERVSWVKADGQSLRLPLRFDLICMTGHAFQTLLTDDDAIAVLRNVHDHLTKDGRFAFETRNPAKRAWLSWTPDRRKLAMTADHGRIEEFFDAVADPQTGIVDIVHHYRFLETEKLIVGRSRLRFIDEGHLMRLLAAAKLTPINWYGDWDRTPLTPTSREFIVLARRAG
jgi:SAM-dependent methyltransferase